MRYGIALLALIVAAPAHGAPLRCQPLEQGSAGGRFLEEVTKVLRDGAFEHLLTGRTLCVPDWSTTVYPIQTQSPRR